MAKQSLEEKVTEIAPELANTAESMSLDELRSVITLRAMLYSGSKEAEKSDEELMAAKESVKLLRAPYAEDQKAAQIIITWVTKLIETRGK